MACGATYAVVPLIRPRAIGSVSGIVAAGGNAGAVLASLLFKSESISGAQAFFILGVLISVCAFSALLVRPAEATVAHAASMAVPAIATEAAE